MKVTNKIDKVIYDDMYSPLVELDAKLFRSANDQLRRSDNPSNGAYVKLCQAFYWDDNMPYMNLQVSLIRSCRKTIINKEDNDK